MALTENPSEVAQHIIDMLEGTPSLGLTAVYYGDQERIPSTPCAAVETGPLNRTLAGASFRTDNTITIFVLLYLAKLQDVQATRKQVDELAEAVMDVLHADINMGGLVIHGHVTSMEPGYAIRGGALMRAARITWTGLSKTSLAS